MNHAEKCNDPRLGALLPAYELNLLSEAEAGSFEVHALGCGYCIAELQALEHAGRLLATDSKFRDDLRKALPKQQRVATGWSRLWQHLWPRVPIVFRPAVVYAIALVLVLAGRYGFRAPALVPLTPVPVIQLSPDRSAGVPVLRFGSAQSGELELRNPDAAPGARYAITVLSQDGHEVQHREYWDLFDESGFANLQLPADALAPGEYRLIVTNLSQTAPADSQVYFFRISEP